MLSRHSMKTHRGKKLTHNSLGTLIHSHFSSLIHHGMIPGLEEWNWCIHTELNFLGCYDWQKTRISEGVEVWFQLRERLKNGRENNKPKIPKLSCGNLQNSRFQFCTHIYKHTIFYLSHIQTCSVQSLDQ